MSTKYKREQTDDVHSQESPKPQRDPAEEFFRREREAYIKRTGENVPFIYRPDEITNKEMSSNDQNA